MELNKETAMRLWGSQFGKALRVKDFTGRLIVKAAYNQRGSEFGWNVDHILPQSRGGKTNDSNLICCSISTNDEKGDSFPSFNANGKNFQIIKVQNHYEIKGVKKQNKKDEDKVNFLDSAAGIRFYKNLKGIQNKPRFVGTVQVKILDIVNTAVINFIEQFFDKGNISYKLNTNDNPNSTVITLVNYDMPYKSNIENLLDQCVTLHTYLCSYFVPSHIVKRYNIVYRVDYFQNCFELYDKSQEINPAIEYSGDFRNTIWLNNLVIGNSSAHKKVESVPYDRYREYNYVDTNLAKNLEKEVKGN